jgi:flavorubredoxin
MKSRKVLDGIHWLGAIDWDRRLFDSLIPTPDGTSYNVWLVEGSEKVVLLDTVDPSTGDALMAQLADVPRVDYVIAHHAEQDHSGMIPAVLARYPEAKLVGTPRCLAMLADLLDLPPDRSLPVKDGDTLDLGGRTLSFMHMPWVHWPETMVTWLPEDRVLFSCDLFGSHLATPDLYATPDTVHEPAMRYYAEIMMPFRSHIAKHLDRIAPLDPALICPSHGPAHRDAMFILSAYREWTSAPPANRVIIPYVSMHGSTAMLVERLVESLAARGIPAQPFNVVVTDLGKLAVALVDAATVVLASPVFLGGAHPLIVSVAYLANALKPKARFAGFLSSYSWGGKIADSLGALMPHLKVEVLEPVTVKGMPREADLAAVDALADAIAAKHREAGL